MGVEDLGLVRPGARGDSGTLVGDLRAHPVERGVEEASSASAPAVPSGIGRSGVRKRRTGPIPIPGEAG